MAKHSHDKVEITNKHSACAKQSHFIKGCAWFNNFQLIFNNAIGIENFNKNF